MVTPRISEWGRGVPIARLEGVGKGKPGGAPAGAAPLTAVTGTVVSAVNGPPAAVLHSRSAAGLLGRAATPGWVLVAVHVGAAALSWSRQGRFELTIAVGPWFATNPAS